MIETLHRATVTALNDPAVRKALGDLGVDLVGSSPAEFSAYIKAEIPKWRAVVQAAGARLEGSMIFPKTGTPDRSRTCFSDHARCARPTPARWRTRFAASAHLDIAGAGQVTVAGHHAYVGHIPNKDRLGTTIIDVADPCNPRVVATITLDDPDSHSHKVRVVGDVMIVNHERNMSRIGRRAEQLPAARAELAARLGREPTAAEIAARMGVSEADLRALEAAGAQRYQNGGFKVYDVADPAKPKLIAYQKTGGIGVHRFAMDARYAYISTEMEGFIGNILVVYDIADPRRPREVSRWWMPGQHLAGGETPDMVRPAPSAASRAALRRRIVGELLAWRLLDRRLLRHRQPAQPRLVQLSSAVSRADPHGDAAAGAHRRPAHRGRDRRGRPGAERKRRTGAARAAARRPCDLRRERSRGHQAARAVRGERARFARSAAVEGARFGAHQFHEAMTGTLVYAVWFSAGLRIVDLADPAAPREVGFFIPEPVAGDSAPQSNDVMLDARGLIHMVDRRVGFDILEFDARA